MSKKKEQEKEIHIGDKDIKIKKPGAFREWCRKRGYDKVTDECIEEGLKSKNKTIRRRAALAKALKKMREKRKKNNKKS